MRSQSSSWNLPWSNCSLHNAHSERMNMVIAIDQLLKFKFPVQFQAGNFEMKGSWLYFICGGGKVKADYMMEKREDVIGTVEIARFENSMLKVIIDETVIK